MYSKLPNLILAFHGCNITTFENVLYNHEHLNASNNSYDWLGNGIYFWEQNIERAWKWAKDTSNRSGNPPAVIGAVIDLGYCLNLSDSKHIEILKKQYEIFKDEIEFTGNTLPKNKNIKNNTDYLMRNLDCAVIESLHESLEDRHEKKYDSVRGVFFEGNEIYPGSGFREKTHIQICVRNPNCIKGYFAPTNPNSLWDIP